MRQTDKYKLNKPGVDDPIAIATLNENMDKVEGAILAEAAERAALAQRVTVIEASQLRIAVGAYRSTGLARFFELPFMPRAVYITSSGDGIGVHALSVTGSEAIGGNPSGPILRLQENGFTVLSSAVNTSNSQLFHFMAFG